MVSFPKRKEVAYVNGVIAMGYSKKDSQMFG